MKKKYINGLCVMLMAGMLLTGCGRATKDSYSTSSADRGYANAEYDNGAEVYNEDLAEDSENGLEEEKTFEEGEKAEETTVENKKISREMLVYRGEATVDTLDFDKSVMNFKAMLDKVGGFVEQENSSDGYSEYEYYRVSEDNKQHTYTALVRVPSQKYDTIMNSTSDLGDVRNKSSNVENVTQRYGTYQAELEVYQAEHDRYMELLKNAKKDETMLEIQEKIFELEVTIADLKSQITNIETDVAYSYVDITIREVSEYQEEPVKKDTFGDRLKNTLTNSANVFLSFLEGLLFFVIYVWYYVVGIVVIVWVSVRRIKKNKHKKNKTENNKNNQGMNE